MYDNCLYFLIAYQVLGSLVEEFLHLAKSRCDRLQWWYPKPQHCYESRQHTERRFHQDEGPFGLL